MRPIGAYLAGGVAGTFALRVAGGVGQLAVALVLARLLGAEGYGRFALGVAVATAVAAAPSWALQGLLTREVSAGLAAGRPDAVRGLLATALPSAGGAALVFAAVLGLAAAWVSGGDAALVWAALLVPALVLGTGLASVLAGLHRVLLAQWWENVLKHWGLVALVALAWLAGSPPGPGGAIALYAAALWAGAAALALLAWHALPGAVRAARPEVPAGWLREALPFAGIGLLAVANGQADVLMLGAFRDDVEVGIYRAASQLAALVIFLLGVVNAPLQPLIARLHAEGDRARLQRAVRATAVLVLACAVPTVAVLVIWGGELMALAFGEPFRSGALPLAILALGQLVNASMGSVGVILNMTGHQRVVMRWFAASGVLTLILLLVLAPPFGAVGAAVAAALGLVAWNVTLAREVMRRLGVNPTALPLPRRWYALASAREGVGGAPSG